LRAGRRDTPEDIAGAAMFPAPKDADYFNGAISAFSFLLFSPARWV
jgi:hypothetical protein